MRRVLAWALLALFGLLALALLEQGDGELDRYKVEDVR